MGANAGGKRSRAPSRSPSSGQVSCSAELVGLLMLLVQELMEQNANLKRLAESNEALTDAILQGEDDDPIDPAMDDRSMSPHPSTR